MNTLRGWFTSVGLAAVLFLVPFAQADQVQMTFTGVGNGSTGGGVYVGPYQATIDGQFALVVCADFSIQTNVGQTWAANVSYSGGDISDTRQAAKVGTVAAQGLYNQAAFLVEQLLATYDPTPDSADRALQRQLSFAIWEIFTPGVIVRLGTMDQVAATGYLNQAAAYAGVANTSLVIYTPVLASGVNAPPQEFLAIRTPEGSATILWGVHMLAALWMIVYFRRRSVRVRV